MSKKDPAAPPENALTLNPQALIQMALEKGAGMETLERLFALSREVKNDQAKEAFHEAMARFQKNCPAIHKDQTGGTKFKYKFSGLGSILKVVIPALSKEGLNITWRNVPQEGDAISANCRITHELGYFQESGVVSLPIDRNPSINGPQQVGSAMSYARRYAAMSILGIAPDDDDDAQSVVSRPAPDNPPRQAAARPSEVPPHPALDTPPTEEDPAVTKMKARLANAGKTMRENAKAPKKEPQKIDSTAMVMISTPQMQKIYAMVRGIFRKVKMVKGEEVPDREASNTAYHEWLKKVFKVDSTKDLSLDEANEVITELEAIEKNDMNKATSDLAKAEKTRKETTDDPPF